MISKDDVQKLKEQSERGRGLWIGLFLPEYPDDPVGRAKHPLVSWLPSDAHVTLLHLGRGRPEHMIDRVCQVLDRPESWLHIAGGIRAEITGVGFFWRRSGFNTQVALVDSAPICAIRPRLTQALDQAEVPISDRYGFIPHITLRESASIVPVIETKGTGSGFPSMERGGSLAVTFHDVHVVCGDHRVGVL